MKDSKDTIKPNAGDRPTIPTARAVPVHRTRSLTKVTKVPDTDSNAPRGPPPKIVYSESDKRSDGAGPRPSDSKGHLQVPAIGVGQPSPVSRHPASVFCKSNDYVMPWMLQQSALTHAFAVNPTGRASNLEPYYLYTKPYYPSWIATLGIVADVKDQLLELQQSIKHLDVGHPPHTELSQDKSDHLKNNILILLRISKEARILKELVRSGENVPEAISRKPWDKLMEKFLVLVNVGYLQVHFYFQVPPSQDTCVIVRREGKLRLPSNNANVSSNDASVSSNNANVPPNDASVSSNNENVSSNDASVLSNNANVSSNDASVSSNNANVSSNDASVSSNNASASSNNANAPPNHANVPPNHANAPSNKGMPKVVAKLWLKTTKEFVYSLGEEQKKEQQSDKNTSAKDIHISHVGAMTKNSLALIAYLESNLHKFEDTSYLHKAIVKGPKTATCDSLITLTITDALRGYSPSEISKFLLTKQSRAEKKTHSSNGLLRPVDENDFNDLFASAILAPATIDNITGQNIAPEPEAPVKNCKTTKSDSNAEGTTWDLHLPILSTEFKRFQTKAEVAGVNQARLYSIACAKFLSVIGIRNFPIFTLITEGTIGLVTCTIVEEVKLKVGSDLSTHEIVRIYERNARTFDISIPLDALNFVTFITWLSTTHAKKLEDEFTKIKPDFLKRWDENDKTLAWTVNHRSPN